ncbi:hypothetical protein [Paucisalibacillus globulus]|uniref:hypothetical protein n=1 Tax=Paucisalibacillus globulus TaxID=351095 RepID=UPI0012EC74FE|nr:hypothetical protein [Paucisalibacillus globulus]
MVAFTGITSTVSAAESSSTGNESVSMLASSYPTEVYVTESRSFSKNHALPPSTIYERRTINGFEYAGTLNRFSYYDADVRWLATYKGWIRAL